jgi:hypothetical protein
MRAVSGLVLIGMALANPGAAAAQCQEHEIRVDGEAAPSLGQNPSNADVISSVASVIRNNLGLPLSVSQAHVCADEAALVEELLRNVGVKGVGAWGTVSSAAGVATPIGVFFRGDYLARADLGGRVAVVAHELAHLSQYRLAGRGTTRIPQWIIEGHAEWVAFRVLDRLGVRAYGASRDRVVDSVVASTILIKQLPDLNALTEHTSWTRSRQFGPAATYGQAFIAVAWLIDRYGSAKLVEYLGQFESSAESQEHWGTVFPIPYGEFIDDFRVYLRGLVPIHGIDDVSELPRAG